MFFGSLALASSAPLDSLNYHAKEEMTFYRRFSLQDDYRGGTDRLKPLLGRVLGEARENDNDTI